MTLRPHTLSRSSSPTLSMRLLSLRASPCPLSLSFIPSPYHPMVLMALPSLSPSPLFAV
eukprot:CAMPEP_0183349816 /NCGR_PEP_ID=MMETSP0164_2-20130417/13883_1 /TAXON_ID=221442 /ORGANISM="Coccolithus pelagicus ssp braarudi, Strain PLY182g" /LENGTH=58 /DNA_ID=CAMNT_0025521605 /DNA_START=43 /DNA_END=215 /DNA_ORIENTATION=+